MMFSVGEAVGEDEGDGDGYDAEEMDQGGMHPPLATLTPV